MKIALQAEQAISIVFKGKMEKRIILVAENIVKSFDGNKILKGINLTLQQGEFVLLRGDNGSGKTTLLNILTGNLEPDSGKIMFALDKDSEHFVFPNSWLSNINPFNHFTPERLSREGVGRTWQEIRLFQSLNLRENVSIATPGQIGENPFWALFRYRSVRKQSNSVLKAAKAMFSKLGLEERQGSHPDKISLGQAKRVAMARAIQAGAQVLYLDEPLSGLDSNGIKEVMGFLEDLRSKAIVSVVIVEHVLNVSHIMTLADTIWTITEGKITCGDEEETKQQNSFHIHGADVLVKLTEDSTYKIVNQDLPGGAVLTRLRREDSTYTEPILEVRDLTVRRGNRLVIGEGSTSEAVKGVSFELFKEEFILLQAPNGWGKTTLLEAIAGITSISGGTIRMNGEAIESLPVWERVNKGIQYAQARDHTFRGLSVNEALNLSRIKPTPQAVASLEGKNCADLSGGEQQKLAVWSVLSTEHVKIIMMDEPFSALDEVSVSKLASKVKEMLGKKTILIAVPNKIEKVV